MKIAGAFAVLLLALAHTHVWAQVTDDGTQQPVANANYQTGSTNNDDADTPDVAAANETPLSRQEIGRDPGFFLPHRFYGNAGQQGGSEEQPMARPFPAPEGGRAYDVAALEQMDGVLIPPNVQRYIDDYIHTMDREMEKKAEQGNAGQPPRQGADPQGLGRQKRDTGYADSQYLVGQLARSIGRNGGYDNGGNGYGYGQQNYGYGLSVPQNIGYGYNYGKAPLLSFVKSFTPGKVYVDKGHVVRNYYRHGTYDVALQHYKLIPTVKVIPYTSYHKIGYAKYTEAKHRYRAEICKDCYHGYPKIDVYEDKKPYSYIVRRFVYLPKQYNLHSYGGYGQSYGYGNSYGHSNSYGYGNSYGGYGNSYGGYGNSYGGYGNSYGGYGNSYGGYGGGYGGYGGGYGGYGGGYGGYGGYDSYGYGGYGKGYGDDYGHKKPHVTYHQYHDDYSHDSYGGYGYGHNSYDSYGHGK